MFPHPLRRQHLRVWMMALLISWTSLTNCVANLVMAQTTDALMDFSPVIPPQGDKIKLVQPTVSWLVKPDAAQYCEQVSDHDGFSVWQEGCVYWSKSKPSCTIVTTANTTHSQMGRLFMYCMHAGEAL